MWFWAECQRKLTDLLSGSFSGPVNDMPQQTARDNCASQTLACCSLATGGFAEFKLHRQVDNFLLKGIRTIHPYLRNSQIVHSTNFFGPVQRIFGKNPLLCLCRPPHSHDEFWSAPAIHHVCVERAHRRLSTVTEQHNRIRVKVS